MYGRFIRIVFPSTFVFQVLTVLRHSKFTSLSNAIRRFFLFLRNGFTTNTGSSREEMCLTFFCAPELKSYDCCFATCSLRRANILLGWFELLLNLAQTGWYTYYLLKFDEIGQIFKFDSKELCIGFIAEGGIFSLACMLFVIGVHMKSPCLMTPYLGCSCIAILVVTGVVTLVVIMTVLFGDFFTGLGIVMAASPILAFLFYLTAIKISYQIHLRHKKAHRRIETSDEEPSPEHEPMT